MKTKQELLKECEERINNGEIPSLFISKKDYEDALES